jgi:uncharacterized protein DUF3224
MSMRATGTFEIRGWDEEPYDEREGAKLARTRVTKVFRGDVEGESVADLLMAYVAEEGSAAYAGFERVVGSVHGRSGSFVLHHSATMTRGEGESSSPWCPTPVPASCGACAETPASPANRTAGTPSPSTTTSTGRGPRGASASVAF